MVRRSTATFLEAAEPLVSSEYVQQVIVTAHHKPQDRGIDAPMRAKPALPALRGTLKVTGRTRRPSICSLPEKHAT